MELINTDKEPIAVYQMGKVGSETILSTLKSLELDNPIYHVHILANNNIQRSISNTVNHNQPLTLQLQNSQTLRKYIDSDPKPFLKVITAVREPVSQLISATFQNLEFSHPQFIEANGNWKEEDIYNFLYNSILNYDIDRAWNCNWFDNDFKKALEIDVYKYEFDRHLGYSVFAQENIKILILRLENSDNWDKYIRDFLQYEEPIKIIKKNTAKNKKYNDIYTKIVSNLKFPVATLERIYSSKYSQHFYSEELNASFINKWSEIENQYCL